MVDTSAFFATTWWCGKPTSLQIVKPLWPFMIAGSLTVYLFAKAQESGIRCASAVVLHPGGSNPDSQLLNGATTRVIPTPLNLPRNLYTRRNVSTFHGGLIKARTSYFFFWKSLAGSTTLDLLLSKVITIFRLIYIGTWTFQACELVCSPSRYES